MASRFIAPVFDTGPGSKPASGAKLNFFKTGESVRKDTFTDAGAGTPNANPVIADSNGVFPDIFISGTYKVILTTKDDIQTGFGEKDPITSEGSGNFNTVLDLTSSRLSGGVLAKTIDYFSTQRGGGATYLIKTAAQAATDGDVIDGTDNQTLANGNVAIIQTDGGAITTSQAGITTATTDANVTLTSIQNRHSNILIDTSFEILARWDLVSDLTVEWLPGTTLKKNAAFPSEKAALFLPDISNVNLIKPNIDGNRINVSNVSEQGHLIDIRGCINITVDGGNCINANGDGYFVGSGGINNFSKNVKLINCVGDNNRRQALSITSVVGLRATNFRGLNTNGTAPGAGVDIEPNSNTDELQDIVFDNPYTEGNEGAGIVIALNLLTGVNAKKVSITINNHEDDGSLLGFQFEKVSLDGTAKISGVIRTIDPVWRNSQIGSFIMRDYDARAPQIQIIRPAVIDPNTIGGTTPKSHSSFICFAETTDTGVGIIGGLRIVEPRFDYSNNAPIRHFNFKDERASRDVTDIQVINPIELIGTIAEPSFTWLGDGKISDENNVVTKFFSSDATLSSTTHAGVISNTATNVVKVTMEAGQNAGDPNVTLEKSDSEGSSATFTVAPPAGGSIIGHPLISAANKTWQCASAESRITLKPVGFNRWSIVSIGGDWRESP